MSEQDMGGGVIGQPNSDTVPVSATFPPEFEGFEASLYINVNVGDVSALSYIPADIPLTSNWQIVDRKKIVNGNVVFYIIRNSSVDFGVAINCKGLLTVGEMNAL